MIQIKLNGKHYHDSITDNEVFILGDKVYVENEFGEKVTQFHNSKTNTEKRIQSGRWEPIYE